MNTIRYLSHPPLSRGLRSHAVRISFLCVLAALLLTSAGVLWLSSGSSFAKGCHHHNHQCDGQGQGQGQGQQQQQVVSCTLVVPANPLTAQGLATPYLLAGAGGNGGGDAAGGNKQQCHENNAMRAAFVQAAIFVPANGQTPAQISVYNPLVIDQGTQPAIAPVVPTIPARATIGLFFGFNGNTLTLVDSQGSLAQGMCVNGIAGSIFGQVSYCNAPAFFQAATTAIQAGALKPPAVGTARDGRPCPTTRDFSVVDQDQSDNVTTTYLVTNKGMIAQNTAANQQQLQNAQLTFNGSDNALLDAFIDPAIGCQPWTVPDLTNPGNMATALPLDELQAATLQGNPVALVPALDPMVLVNNAPNLGKLNAYRVGVDQVAAASLADANTTPYCQNLLQVGLPRVALDKQFTMNAASPFPNMASTLFNFLAMRFRNSFSNQQGFLHCTKLLGVKNPVTLVTQNGVVVGATINLNGNGGPCPLTPTAQGQTMTAACCPQNTATAQGQTQIPCCLTATAQGQQNTGAVCASPTQTGSTSPTPTVSPTTTPTPSVSPTGDTPTPTVEPSPSPQDNG
jgi:hypothetical protein